MYIKIVCKDCGKCLREGNVDSDDEIIVPLCSDCKKEVYEDGYSTGYDDGEADNCQDDN